MSNSDCIISIGGEAHFHFHEIHNFLENEKLTIVSRSSWIPPHKLEINQKYSRIPTIDDLETKVKIVCGHNVDLQKEVNSAIEKINVLFPNCARIVAQDDNK